MEAVNIHPVGLSIAGFDGSGGAGILADCRTFERLGVYGTGVITAVVAQSPGSVSMTEPVSRAAVRSQLTEILSTYPISVVKTGMLGSWEIIEELVETFRENSSIPLVVDPVLKATAGTPLLGEDSYELLCSALFPLATLVTPNIHEADTLLKRKITSPEDMEDAAKEFYQRFGCNALIKGGHLKAENDEVYDAICIDGESCLITGDKLDIPDLHGTGCVLASAIASGLAKQSPLKEAIMGGRNHLRDWMLSYHTWEKNRTVHALNSLVVIDDEDRG